MDFDDIMKNTKIELKNALNKTNSILCEENKEAIEIKPNQVNELILEPLITSYCYIEILGKQ